MIGEYSLSEVAKECKGIVIGNDVKICRKLQEMSPVFKQDWQNAIKNKVAVKSGFYQLAAFKQGCGLQKPMENYLVQKPTTTELDL